MKISRQEYNNSNTQYLQDVHRKTGYKKMSETAKPDIAAVYVQGETDIYAVYSPASVKSTEINPGLVGKMKTYLRDMGFYNGEMGGAVTEELKKSLICFQQAYLSPTNFDTLKNGISAFLINKVDEIGAAFYTNYSNGKAAAALKALGFTNPSAESKQNFARIWTFLDKGMKCTTQQIAGVLGNVMQECRFNNKAENPNGALGIFQWKDERRAYLEHFASEYGHDSKSIGTQLAYFRYEVSAAWGKDHLGLYAQNSHLVDGWKEFMRDCTMNYDTAAIDFMKKIEGTKENEAERRIYAKSIYNAVK